MTEITEKPLKDVLVLDMTHVLAGPYCTMVLKNLGARIVKIEPPHIGDVARLIGPYTGENNTKSAYFMSVNAGKESLSLDLKTDKGKKIFGQLIKKADVLVENFRPGKLAALGFSAERIRELNPGIVYSSVSGFGQTGPMSNQPAFDMIIQALSGLISITGFNDGQTTRVGTSISDIMAGVFSAIGILSVLHRRNRCGQGGRVDVAMLDSSVAILENAIARFQVEKKIPGPIGTRHPSITPFGTFKSKDREFVIAAGNDNLFADLCHVLDLDHLTHDERFSSNSLRTEHAKELTDILNRTLVKETAAHWMTHISNAQVPCSEVNDVGDLFSYEQLSARQMLKPVQGEDGFLIAASPIKIDGIPEDENMGRFPQLGEHNEKVLAEILEYSPNQIRTLYSEKILYQKS
ncbi:CoA transferase [bacterium]|nr:CoA transferase [bacterium]